ncbi:terminase large subunit [Vibrio phage CHOED]|uniref:terminase large subunit n=1 Tax=Vibrio phage CHOED TaxID=1458716 RepID=UPI00042E2FF8|nr:terminase large subunit [Vibrio phage CHOED]AHK11948.1 terminase-like family protein [Vibrio phage CHOED]
MANFEKDLAQYETILGTISGETLRHWMKIVPNFDEKYTKLTEEPIRYRGRYVPLGYTGKKGAASPVKAHILAIIIAFAKCKFEKRYSLGECAQLLSQVGLNVTKAGLSKVFPRYSEALGLTEHIPDSDAKVVEIKSLADAEKLVQRERKNYAKQALKEGKSGEEVREEMIELRKKGTSRKPTPERVIEQKTEEELEEFRDREIVYEPTTKQMDFHAASEKVVLYGGAAGGGKSYALVFDAVRYAHVPGYRAVIIRKTTKALREIILTTKQFYPKLFPGAKFNKQEGTWTFPSGAIVELSYCERIDDVEQYQGQQYQYIAFDELGQWPDEECWMYLFSRLRNPPTDPRTGEKIPTYMRATSNPGASWVKEMFIDAAPANTTFYNEAGLSMKFIPATLLDNPHLDKEYRQMLMALPEVKKRQLLYGDWNATDTAAFPEFRPEGTMSFNLDTGEEQVICDPHVIEPFEIPLWWNRVGGLDYGYTDPATAVWYAINPDTGQKIVYEEYNKAGRTGKEFAQDVLECEKGQVLPIDHPLDWSVFNKSGHTGPTVGEEMRRTGLIVRKADKNRVGGKVQIHEHLRPMKGTTKPGLVIFNTCPRLIAQLRAAQIKENEPDDIDQTRVGSGSARHHWDLYDSLRYGLMARPTLINRADQMHQVKRQSQWNRVQRYFS